MKGRNISHKISFISHTFTNNRIHAYIYIYNLPIPSHHMVYSCHTRGIWSSIPFSQSKQYNNVIVRRKRWSRARSRPKANNSPPCRKVGSIDFTRLVKISLASHASSCFPPAIEISGRNNNSNDRASNPFSSPFLAHDDRKFNLRDSI